MNAKKLVVRGLIGSILMVTMVPKGFSDACGEDLKKNPEMWAKVKKNKRALYAILQEYSPSLSPECKKHIAEVKGIRAEIIAACPKVPRPR